MNLDDSPARTEHPPLMGLAKLMTRTYRGEDMTPVHEQLLERCHADASDANAMMDLSILLQFQGQRELAVSMQREALAVQQIYHLPCVGERPGLRLLALMTPGDLMANTPLEFLVEDSDIAVDMVYTGPNMPLPDTLPEHDVAFVAISESDANQPTLEALQAVVAQWPRPVLNQPERIAGLSRDDASERLRSIEGVVMPRSVRVDRRTLGQVVTGSQSAAALLGDGDFPIIARPVDSHAGHGLAKLDGPQAVADYLRQTPSERFYLARYVDYRSEDGLFRKYRIVWIQGQPFACHMGLSENWMIHYLNAAMEENLAKRDEEARFMANFDADFAARHRAALSQIYQRMGLDYLGIDCGQTADGSLLVFEAHSSMVVHAMDSPELFPYKRPQMDRVFAAFRAMLKQAAA